MTISTITTHYRYLRNGTTTQWSFPNKIFAAGDLIVTDFDTSTPPVTTVLVLGVDYLVSNVDVDTGAIVTTTLPGTNGHTLDIRSSTPRTQSTSVKNQGPFNPELHEEAFDRLTRMLQDTRRQTYQFGIHGPDNEGTAWPTLPPASVRALTNLGFDGNGLPAVNLQLLTGTLSASTIGQFLYANAVESAAGITPANLQYPLYDWRRYDASGGLDYTAAMLASFKLGRGILAANTRYPVLTQNTALSGQFVLTGEGPTSVIACDGILFTLTGASNSQFYNFGLDSITTPQLYQRTIETTIQTTGATTANGKQITVASAAGIVVGMRVMGPYVWNGTTVQSIAGNVVTVSDGSSETTAGPVEFYNITFNTGAAAVATLTTTKADGFRPVSVNDTDMLAVMGSTAFNAAIAAGQLGPVLQITGDHVQVERLTTNCASIQLIGCNYSTMRNCDTQGGWTWGACAFLNFGTTRCKGNAALGNRFRHHAYEGVMLMGQDNWRVEHNYAYGCGDSGFETYQQGSTSGGSFVPNSVYFDGGIGGVSVGNIAVANWQGAFNYESNFGAGFLGYNTAMSTSSGDYAAWHPLGACAYTGNGWSISGLVCEYNAAEAIFANISNSVFCNSTFRENQYGNVGSFSAITIVGSSNLIHGIRAYQETTRTTAYTMNVVAGTGLGANTTMRDIDLRDTVTPTTNQLLLAAFPNNILRKNVRIGTIGSGPGALDAPENLYAMLQQTTSQTLAAATNINVAFNVATTDPFGVCDLANHRFSGMPAGKYKVSATVAFQSTSATAVDYYMSIALNGAVPGANSAIQHCTPSAAGQNYTLSNTEIVTITALTDNIAIVVQPYNTTATIGLSASYATLERLGDY